MNCKAVRCNDEMQCGTCGLTWPVDDPDPPRCVIVDSRQCYPDAEDDYLQHCVLCGGAFTGPKRVHVCAACRKGPDDKLKAYGARVMRELRESLRYRKP